MDSAYPNPTRGIDLGAIGRYNIEESNENAFNPSGIISNPAIVLSDFQNSASLNDYTGLGYSVHRRPS